MPSTKDILAVVMGGGQGTRLYPLTKVRAKPAVPIAGKYRLIDIPISNCINSNMTALPFSPNSIPFHFTAILPVRIISIPSTAVGSRSGPQNKPSLTTPGTREQLTPSASKCSRSTAQALSTP